MSPFLAFAAKNMKRKKIKGENVREIDRKRQ
jgi:hypothetical protein